MTLFEKEKRLGGQFYLAAVPPYKGEISAFLAWQTQHADKLGVRVVTDTALTAQIVKDQKPDAVIVATGSAPTSLRSQGSTRAFVTTAQEVLEGTAALGVTIAVIGRRHDRLRDRESSGAPRQAADDHRDALRPRR